MEPVRCTNCGSAAILPDGTGEFCKCEACGSTFNVPKAAAFGKVQLDRTQDIRAWREYLAKQLRLQQDSNKARDYGGVKLFAQKILSVLPDDFCASYYSALADRYTDNDVEFTNFLKTVSFDGVTPDELKEATNSLVAAVEPKYLDITREFIARAYPSAASSFDAILDRNVKQYIQKLRFAKVTDRDVFICHRTAAPDQDIADAICTRLEERGLRCWIAPRNILAGSQNYERDILNGVKNSRVFLLVSSFKSLYSEDCETELKAAVLDGKALYSYRIDDTPYDGAFERALASVQWLDASDDPYAHLEQLVIDIKGILANDEREKAELEEKRLAAREKERIQAEERRAREQQRIERLERIVSGGVAASAAAAPSVSFYNRLHRASVEVQAQNYERAQDILDEVLDEDPECAEAWWLLILCDYRLPSDTALIESGKDFTAHRYYTNVVRFSDDEPEFVRRLERTSEEFLKRTVRNVTVELDEAERLISLDGFASLAVNALDKCADVFADENSVIFKRFPDVASRYYWLRLWTKYGQTPLVCVEDITRETEYGKAMKYASPAQAREYEKAKSTVSRNAEMFLRERSKNRANDDKLADYLVDNRNILPVDTYNYYSSLLYFRKMLKDLRMTESELRASEVDISTNEYFMLAQSVATVDQRREYNEILRCIDENRAATQKRVTDEKNRVLRNETLKKAANIALTVLVSVFAGLSYLFATIAFGLCADFEDTFVAVRVLFIISTAFRIASDAVNLANKSKRTIAFTYINFVLTIFMLLFTNTFGCMAFFDVVNALSVNSGGLAVLSIACFVLEVIKMSKHKKQTKK